MTIEAVLPEGNEPLTPQELRIAELITRGFDYKEIIQKLSIKESTLKRHITHILNKVAIEKANKAVIAAWYVRTQELKLRPLSVRELVN